MIKKFLDKSDRNWHRNPALCCMAFLFFCVGLVSAQDLIYVRGIKVQFDPTTPLSTASFQKPYQNRVYTPELIQEIRTSFDQFMKSNGYYFSHVDTIMAEVDPRNRRADIIVRSVPGKPLVLDRVSIVNADSLSGEQLKNVDAISENHTNKLYTAALTSGLYEKILQYFENNGYPLARIHTEGFRFSEDEKTEMRMELQLRIEKGDSVNVEYLRFPDGADKANTYLARLLRFKPGMGYNQQRIDRYSQILGRQDFIKSVSKPALMIDAEGNYFVDVSYQEAPSTTLDGIVGYIPPPVNSEEDGYFTGLVNMGIRNLFGTGRKLLIFWQKQDRFSDEFRLAYREPFVLGLPFHTDLGLYRLVRDTTYIEWKYDARFELPLNEFLSAYLKLTSRQVAPDSLASSQLRLPETKSVFTETGIEWDLRDQVQNPRKGIHLQVSVSLGRQENVGPPYLIEEDSLQEKVTIQKAAANLEVFIPTFRRQVFANRIHAEGISASGDILRLPDMIWFGGATSLRGYREAQFFGERVAWLNTEYRFLLGPQSRFFFFVDNGYFLRKLPVHQEKWLTGYGLGLRFTAPLGILQVDFGMEKGTPFREGKIHFRLINEF